MTGGSRAELSAPANRPDSGNDRRGAIVLGAFLLALYIFVVVLSIQPAHRYLAVWSKLTYMVDTANPFRDLRWITISQEVAREGGDPLVECRRCPDGRPINYPRVWLLPRHLGIGEKDTLWLGWATIFVLLGSAYLFARKIGRPGPRAALLYLLFFISPPTLMAIERINNDVYIFIVLALGLVLNARPPGYRFLYPSLFLATVLKIYPVVGFLNILTEPRRRGLIIGLSLFGLSLVYLAAIFDDIILIFHTVPRSMARSYGGAILLGAFRFKFGPWVTPFYWLAVVATPIMAAWAAVSVWRRSGRPTEDDQVRWPAFVVAATIFPATYFFGIHWDCRLIFLVLALPYLTHRSRVRDRPGRWAKAMPILILVALYASHIMIIRPYVGVRWHFLAEYLVELFNWGLAAGMLFFLFSGLLARAERSIILSRLIGYRLGGKAQIERAE